MSLERRFFPAKSSWNVLKPGHAVRSIPVVVNIPWWPKGCWLAMPQSLPVWNFPFPAKNCVLHPLRPRRRGWDSNRRHCEMLSGGDPFLDAHIPDFRRLRSNHPTNSPVLLPKRRQNGSKTEIIRPAFMRIDACPQPPGNRRLLTGPRSEAVCSIPVIIYIFRFA
jgi:hypothetical protein